MNGLPDTQATQIGMGNQFATETPVAGLPWRLMIFAILLFAFSIFVYFGIRFGYESYLMARKDKLATDTQSLAKQISSDDQNQFVNFYSQIFNMKKVLANHKFSANVFNFFENKAVSGVYFTNAIYNAQNLRLDIDGVALSNATLVQQLSVLDSSPEVSEAILTQMKYDEVGRVIFGIKLKFKDTFFGRSL
ncbi:MAG: hypothetical protein AAB920_01915 [Patescibacteria group bacterium]